MGFKQQFSFTGLIVRYVKFEEDIPWAVYLVSICFIFFGIYLSQTEINQIITQEFYAIIKLLYLAIIGIGFLIFALAATRRR